MKRSLRILLSVFSGILLSLPWFGSPGWGIFVAFLPLLYLEDFFTENKESYAAISFWGHAFLTFFIWNGLTTWWIMHATVVGAVMAVFVNSFLMSLVFWLAHFARRNLKSNLGYIALVVFWISFEFFHFQWDIEWPWLTLGNAFANQVKMVQWYEFTGVLGGSLWILWVNILVLKFVLEFINERKFNTSVVFSATGILIIVFLPLFVSFRIYSKYDEKGDAKNIVIVQPNVNPYHENYDRDAEEEKIRNLIQLAKSATSIKTDFIVGPETVVENYYFWDEDRLRLSSGYLMLSNFLQDFPKAELLFGASTVKFYNSHENVPKTAREKNGKIFDVFNSALFFKAEGEIQIYHKSVLVSGVEKVPFMKYLGFLKNLFFDLGGASGNLGSQDESSVFIATDGTKIAPVICFESVFGEYVTSYVQKGAELIFIITNDGWWENTPGYKQHLSFARLRAIETRRSIARAANTGISCFINQKGEIENQTQWNEKTVTSGVLRTNKEITFYVKFGDFIARISLFSSVLLLLFLVSNQLRKEQKKPH